MTYTRLEQEFLERLPDGALLEHRMLLDINKRSRLTTKKMLNVLIAALCQKGALIRLKRGRYLVVKDGQPDPLLVGNLALGGYVSFDTALFFYKYRHTVSNTVYCATNREVKTKARIAGSIYVGVPMDGLAFGYAYIGGRKIATKAKLAFDIAYTKFRYVEEISPVLDLVRDLDEGSVSELISYLNSVNQTALYERIGFLFKIAGGSKKLIVHLWRKIEKGVIVKLNPGIRESGFYDGEWHVYDNMGAHYSAARRGESDGI